MFFAQQDERLSIEFTFAPLREDFGVPLAVMGIMVVFLALVLVVVFISVLPRALAAISGSEREESVTAPAAIGEEELPEEMVAVIAAAVAAVLGKPQRIVRIRGLTPADLGWSHQGRMQHHQSHQIQHRGRQ